MTTPIESEAFKGSFANGHNNGKYRFGHLKALYWVFYSFFLQEPGCAFLAVRRVLAAEPGTVARLPDARSFGFPGVPI
jgi:hypothetical protein